MTQAETSLFEVINTQRAIRHFTTDPVSDEDITKILQAAIHAPNGGNQQLWHFLVIRDREAKRRLGQWYLEAWKTTVSEKMRTLQQYRSGADLGNDMPDTPVVILVCVEHQTRARELGSTTTQGSSIYPAVQNLMLAARGLGLGTVLTTLHTVYEKEVKEYFGIPDDVDTVAMIPIGYPGQGERFGRPRRRPLEEVSSYEKWGQKKS
jgi:nitroreductase